MKLKASFLFTIRTLFGSFRSKGEGRSAKRYLRGAILGIAFSLVPLIVVIEVANGMIEGITARYMEVASYHLSVGVPTQDPDVLEVATKAAQNSYLVESAVPIIDGFGVALSGTNAQGAVIRALSPSAFLKDARALQYYLFTVDRKEFLDYQSARARGLLDPSGKRSNFGYLSDFFEYDESRTKTTVYPALVSVEMARKLSLKPGDVFQLINGTENGESSGAGQSLTRIRVAGIFSSGYQELDSNLMLLPLSKGFNVISLKNSEFKIGVKVADPYSSLSVIIDRLRTNIDNEISRNDMRTWVPCSITTWQEANAPKYGSFDSTKSILYLIMGLIALVASVNVLSALVMLVLEKQREIAIMKSVGASPAGITLSFMSAGFFTAFIGIGLGTALGLLIAININEIIHGIEGIVNVGASVFGWLADPLHPASEIGFKVLDPSYYLTVIPIRIRYLDILCASGGLLLFSLIVSYIPARKAGRMKPLDVLRKH